MASGPAALIYKLLMIISTVLRINVCMNYREGITMILISIIFIWSRFFIIKILFL